MQENTKSAALWTPLMVMTVTPLVATVATHAWTTNVRRH